MALLMKHLSILRKCQIFTNYVNYDYTAQKMMFSIRDFFCKRNQIRRKLRIWSHLLKKSLMENIIFCTVLLFALQNHQEF